MKENILFLCLDSARYDTFAAARAPNMKGVGKLRKAHSFACWTLPSMLGYFMGYPPIGTGFKSLFPYHDSDSLKWVPQFFLRKGYATVWLSCNQLILVLDRVMGGNFKRGFKHFRRYLKKPPKTDQIFRDASNIVKKESRHPIFMAMLVMATHHSFYDGRNLHRMNPKRPKLNFANQVKAIEYVDSLLPPLYRAFKQTKRPTVVIITADHGDLFGPKHWGHSPCYHLGFSPKLFEIPFIRGKIR